MVCHDDPDPDCLASAVGLAVIARWAGVSTVQYFDGNHLSHPQNQALVDYLDIRLRRTSDPALGAADALALVDHAVPGTHNSLPPGTPVDIVLDHHQYDRPVEGDIVDLRPAYGATVTIVVEYLLELGVSVSTPVASALLFALHRERLDHARHPTPTDYAAATALAPLVDSQAIDHFYRSGTTTTTVDALATAIRNRTIDDSCLVSWVGTVAERDALPQAADYLLSLQEVDTVLVLGMVDGDLQMSARSVDPSVDLGKTLPRIVGPNARVGGHRDMAGGLIPATALPPSFGTDPADSVPLVETLTSRFCSAVSLATDSDANRGGPDAEKTGGSNHEQPPDRPD
ncbi:DHH family phosphoesterase [Halobacteriales archaeon Cl-PHB]